MNLKETYDKIAELWHSDHASDSWWKADTDKFLSMLNPGASILDAGCGAGTKSKYMLEKGFKVTGIDFSEKMIELCKREYPNGEFEVRDFYDLDGLRGTFDAVFSQASMLHIPKRDVPDVLKKLANKIKSGGLIYIAVKKKHVDEKEEEMVTESDYGFEYTRFFSYFLEDELSSFMKNAGIDIIYEHTFEGKRSWIQLIGKKK